MNVFFFFRFFFSFFLNQGHYQRQPREQPFPIQWSQASLTLNICFTYCFILISNKNNKPKLHTTSKTTKEPKQKSQLRGIKLPGVGEGGGEGRRASSLTFIPFQKIL